MAINLLVRIKQNIAMDEAEVRYDNSVVESSSKYRRSVRIRLPQRRELPSHHVIP